MEATTENKAEKVQEFRRANSRFTETSPYGYLRMARYAGARLTGYEYAGATRIVDGKITACPHRHKTWAAATSCAEKAAR